MTKFNISLINEILGIYGDKQYEEQPLGDVIPRTFTDK
jgi:hypothetical protein